MPSSARAIADPPADDDSAAAALGALLAAAGIPAADARGTALATAFGSLAALSAASAERVARVAGPAAATLIAAHRRAMLLALREPAVRGPILATRYDLLEYLHHAQGHARAEQLRVFFLDGRRELLAEEVVAQGGAGALPVEPRAVLARALELGAAGLILVHNHPGGDAAPSAADRAFTRRLASAAATLDIALHDHLVVARGGAARIA